MSSQSTQPDVCIVGESVDSDYSTIQKAHDELPDSEPEEGYGSGLIIVDGTYDSSKEEFPIHVTKYLDIRGRSRTRSRIICDDDDVDVFYVERLSEGHHGPASPNAQVNISHLYIQGGRDGIVLDGITRFNGSYLIIEDASRDGISAVRNRSEGSLNSGYLERVDARRCGRRGFSLPSETNPHAYSLIGCQGNYCGDVGAHLGGFTINILGGAYQYCGGPGLELEAHEFGAGAIGIYNAYLEYNGSAQQHPREVVIGDNIRGAKLHNCYLTGHNDNRFEGTETHAAIESHDNADCEIDHCTFRGYQWCGNAGLFDISDDSTNIELNLGSHHRFHGADEADTFLRRPEMFYSGRVRHGTEPTTINGRYDGEQAYANGTLYVWSANESEWFEV